MPPDAHLDGVTPAELAQAFHGTRKAPLRWTDGSNGAADAGPPLVADEITIGITYEGGTGEKNGCSNDSSVEVVVDVTTTDTAIHEIGKTLLLAPRGSLEEATFAFAGGQYGVTVRLHRSQGIVEQWGTLLPLIALALTELDGGARRGVRAGGHGCARRQRCCMTITPTRPPRH